MRFQPEASYTSGKHQFVNHRHATYKELLKALPAYLVDSDNSIVTVNRSRRGQWGEWFEQWAMQKGKPVIIKQGWM